jgi:hypothetical protein
MKEVDAVVALRVGCAAKRGGVRARVSGYGAVDLTCIDSTPVEPVRAAVGSGVRPTGSESRGP